MDIRLDNARISFAQGLWTASSATQDGVKKYNCDFIITEETKVLMRSDQNAPWQETTIEKCEQQVALDAFKGDKQKAVAFFNKLDGRQRSVRDGNKQTDKGGEVRDGYADRKYVHATSKTRMPVYDGNAKPVAAEENSPIYSGCYVRARISLYANLKSGQQGVFASLQGTQFMKDGDAFGGGRAASQDDFEAVAGADAEDFA